MTRVTKGHNICYSGHPNSHQIVKIHNGVKEGFKIHLNGPNGQSPNASIEGPLGHNYVITPAGAPVGENIAINEHGLYIRARQNKKQLITATSCPDNQVKVQVGQGKSAVQLSIQVAPQGRRGEVELNCSRNETENGGTGYTVSVNREKHDRKVNADQIKQQAAAIIASKNTNENQSDQKLNSNRISPSICDPKEDKTVGFVTASQNSKFPLSSNSNPLGCSSRNEHCIGFRPMSMLTPTIKNQHDDRETFDSCCLERQKCDASDLEPEEKIFVVGTAQDKNLRCANLSDKINQANALEKLYRERELLLCAELKRFTSQNYKRKLDLHHHKPTISYLIGRRMTALFKEMRKSSELHPPIPPFVKF